MPYNFTHMWNVKNKETNKKKELKKKRKKINTQAQKTHWWLPEGKGLGGGQNQ